MLLPGVNFDTNQYKHNKTERGLTTLISLLLVFTPLNINHYAGNRLVLWYQMQSSADGD